LTRAADLLSSSCDPVTGICTITVTPSAEYIGTNSFTLKVGFDNYIAVAAGEDIIVSGF
jgi:hypothetical protein